jgi:DNA-directed RNA polymerase subunit N (RpoN/RPB10)
MLFTWRCFACGWNYTGHHWGNGNSALNAHTCPGHPLKNFGEGLWTGRTDNLFTHRERK